MGAARARLRRPPLGGRGPARLPRPSGRLGDECASRPDLHGAPGAARAAPGLGRARERGHDRACAAERAETGTLVGHLLRQTLVASEFSRALLARAEGNPLYAEEFVRMLVDRGFLYRNGGGWQLREGELPLPESVQGIIAARIDALQLDAKLVLQDAAVIGRGFWPDAVAAVGGLERAEVEQHPAVAGAKRARPASRHERGRGRAPSTPSATRSFATSRTGRSPVQSERGRHLLAASWIESLGRREDHAETLAHHYLSAVEFARAADQGTEAFADAARSHAPLRRRTRARLHAHGTAARFFAAALESLHPRPAPNALSWSTEQRRARSPPGAFLRTSSCLRATNCSARATSSAAPSSSRRSARSRPRRDQSESLAHARRAVELLHDAAPSRSKAHVLRNGDTSAARRRVRRGDPDWARSGGDRRDAWAR